MKAGLPIAGIVVALIGAPASPALAQQSAESPASIIAPVPSRAEQRIEREKKAAERAKRAQAIDEAYQATTSSQPNRTPKSTDPWAKMR